MNYKRAKVFLLLFIFCMISFFTNDFQLINIEKTAIIVAIGIDKADEGFEVSAQIAIPQATNQSTTNEDAILSAKAKTIYGALENISLKTGWYPKLTFCNVIVISKEVIDGDFMPIINYFLNTNRIQSSAVLSVCEKKAKEVLSSSTPLDYISSFALQKILLRNIDRTSSVLISNIQDFYANMLSHSSFGYLPYIKSIQTDDKPKESSGASSSSLHYQKEKEHHNAIFLNSQSSNSGGGQGQDGSEQGQKSSLYDASQSLLFSHGKLACIFTSDQTNCYNLLTKPVKESFLSVDYERMGEKRNALVSIVENFYKIKLKIEKGIPTLIIELKIICEKEEETPSSYQEKDKWAILPIEALNMLETKLKETIDSLIKLSKSTDCDFMQVKEKLYRFHPNHYHDLEKNILQLLDYQIKVECKNHH